MFERKAPELKNLQAWVNSKPLTLEELKGKVVLLDFWTYSCINCIRTLRNLRKMHETYSKKGLVIIGIHTPEFEFEKDLENVKKATIKHELRYPIALDNNHTTWSLYGNQYWPRSTLIDSKGIIRMEHVGEGGYDEIEDKIIELLTEIGFSVNRKVVEPHEMNYQMGITPETYCGFLRNPGIGNLPTNDNYTDVKEHRLHTIYLQGKWIQKPEFLRLETIGYILLKYSARSVNAVMKPVYDGIETEILLDNKPVPKNMAGKDIIFKNGKSIVLINHADMYNLIDGKNFEIHELKILAKTPFQIYAYTFG